MEDDSLSAIIERGLAKKLNGNKYSVNHKVPNSSRKRRENESEIGRKGGLARWEKFKNEKNRLQVS